MKENKQESLLMILRNALPGFVSAQELADNLGVSTRQVRKYITSINQNAKEEIINSSNKGYRLHQDTYHSYLEKTDQDGHDSPQSRKNYMIQKLICFSEGYDIFDFAEELFVSVSTIENDLKLVRKEVKPYELVLERDKSLLYFVGEEKDKRNLMSHLITSDSYDNFILKEEVQILSYHYHFYDFQKDIRDIFARNDIFVNDYTLNNTTLHLIITIDRIRNHCELQEDVDLNIIQNTKQFVVAKSIAEYIEQHYQVLIHPAELYNLTLIISNNTTMMDYAYIDASNMDRYIEQTYIDIARQVIHKVEDCYYLDPFDEDFIVKFTIHVKNLFNRVEHDYFAKNPLTKKIKVTYPLIYDIAVFIAQEFKCEHHIILNEDEIAFIAFHIGSYFENNVQSKTKITCMFIYADYYSLHNNTLEKICRKFEDKINMKYAISIHNYNPQFVHADLIISMVDRPFPTPYINLNPFLTDKDIQNLQRVLETILAAKRRTALKAYLMNFFDRDLFFKDIPFENEIEAIQYLSKEVIALSYANETLCESVLARENMSSTAFHNVAVPHSLSKDIKRSFISISIHQTPIPWEQHSINIIAFIGVHEDARRMFAEVFDELIEILSEPANVKELIKAKDFDDFSHRVLCMMDTLQD